jgi:hypothetical protein
MFNQQPSRREGTASGSGEGLGSAAGAGPVLKLPLAPPKGLTQEIRGIDEQLMLRIERLPKEAGWALITAGVIGVIAPGIVGVPFLVAGAFVLAPGGPQTLSRWAGRKPRKFAHSALRQICRFIDDLERRYPHHPRAIR